MSVYIKDDGLRSNTHNNNESNNCFKSDLDLVFHSKLICPFPYVVDSLFF